MNEFKVIRSEKNHFFLLWHHHLEKEKKLRWKCSESALKKARKRVVSVQAQTRTNKAKITVPHQTWKQN